MNKHLPNSLRALFLSLAVLLSLPMLAVRVEIDGINYDLDAEAKQATVSSGRYSGKVVIPKSVEHEGAAYSVTSIGNKAFRYCSGLTSVTIPNSVTSIGKEAFYSSGLPSVTIPNSVTSIGKSAFQGCSGLTSVHISDIAAWCNIDFDGYNSNPLYYAHHLYLNGEEVKDLVIPNSVTSIGNYAFDGCSGLTSVTIPNSVTSIGKEAFSGCSGLTSVTIPNSVTSIGNYAFDGCSGLTSVTIPNSVTSIGVYAFEGCSGLTSVTIPNSVTSIGISAFENCSGLTSVTIPNSVTSIGDYAFRGCSGLTSIVVEEGNPVYDSRNNCNAIVETASNSLICGCNTSIIPNSVTSIGDYAFRGCSGLTSVTIPNSVTSIGDMAFRGCSGLTSLTIPNSVTSIGNGAFSGLTSIVVEEGNPVYDSRNNCNAIVETASNSLICGCNTSIIPNSVTGIGDYAFDGCSGLTSVTIPNSVTSIGDHAFSSCSGLTSVTIPNSVTSIGEWAFGFCPELLDVYCYAEKVPSTGGDVFYGSYIENATLHVPDASVDSYKATRPWSGFGKIVALTPEETGIDELKGENGKVKTALYDLSGRRVQKAQKGVFIKNGKVMVR